MSALTTDFSRISRTDFSGRDEMWHELLLRHESVDIDPAESPIDPENYCSLESPSRDGNVVRMPREIALKILALGFMDEAPCAT